MRSYPNTKKANEVNSENLDWCPVGLCLSTLKPSGNSCSHASSKCNTLCHFWSYRYDWEGCNVAWSTHGGHLIWVAHGLHMLTARLLPWKKHSSFPSKGRNWDQIGLCLSLAMCVSVEASISILLLKPYSPHSVSIQCWEWGPYSLGNAQPPYTIAQASALEKSLRFHQQMTELWPNRSVILSRDLNRCLQVIF